MYVCDPPQFDSNDASDLFPGALNKETFHSNFLFLCFIALFISPSMITNDSQSASVFLLWDLKGKFTKT